MKRVFLFILVSFLMCGCLNDDHNEDVLMDILYNYKDERWFSYSAVPENNKQMVWHEEFDNNDSKWPFDIAKAHQIYDEYYPQYRTKAIIENGYLLVTSNMPISMNRHFELPVFFDSDKNYEIEFCIGGDSGYSIYWDEDWNEHYYLSLISLFFYDADGNKKNSHFDKLIEENEEKLKLWGSMEPYFYYKQSKEFWFPNKFNTITVRKINNKYTFFINQKFFYRTTYQNKFILKTAALWINNKGSKVDYVRIQYIKD